MSGDALRVVRTLDDAVALREWVRDQGTAPIALDTETTDVDVHGPDFRVRTIQFGNSTEAWFVPLEPWTGVVRECIDLAAGQFLIHNAKFDLPALRRHDVNIPWHKVDDTFIAMRLAEPHKPSGLKPSAVRHVSAGADRSQDDLHKAMKRNGWTWASIPIDFPAYVFYACMDTVILHRLAQTEVCERGLKSPMYPVEMDYLALASIMERNGLRINRDMCTTAMLDIEEEMGSIEAETMAISGINVRSNMDLAKWLHDHGARLVLRTDSGAWSVTKEALDIALAYGAPPATEAIIAKTLRLRKIQKLYSSYFSNFLEFSDDDGLLHPSIETIAARTGRSSIRRPGLQTLPSDGEDPDFQRVRQAVIPRREGHKLVTCDYSQVELRLMAILSEDPELQQAFIDADTTGSDFFTEATKAVYGDPTIPKSDRRRHGVKTLFYASSYGAGIAKMAATAGMPVEEMSEVSGRVFARYPGIKRGMKALEVECKAEHGWIKTLYGREIWVDPDFAYKAWNGKVQGTAADILKMKAVNLAHAGMEDFMVIPVHDEILFSIPEEDVKEASHVIETTMSDTSFDVALLAEPSKPGMTWGEIK